MWGKRDRTSSIKKRTQKTNKLLIGAFYFMMLRFLFFCVVMIPILQSEKEIHSMKIVSCENRSHEKWSFAPGRKYSWHVQVMKSFRMGYWFKLTKKICSFIPIHKFLPLRTCDGCAKFLWIFLKRFLVQLPWQYISLAHKLFSHFSIFFLLSYTHNGSVFCLCVCVK